MSIYTIFILLNINLLSIYTLPINDQISVYHKMVELGEQPEFKCLYLRNSILFEPQPEFLQECKNFNDGQSLINITINNQNDARCILYYNNFGILCTATNNILNSSLQTILNNETLKKQPSSNIDVVCDQLIKYSDGRLNNSLPGIQVMFKLLQDHNKCRRICSELNDDVLPICSLSAYMSVISATLNKTYTTAKSTTLIETGVESVTKPRATKHQESQAPHISETESQAIIGAALLKKEANIQNADIAGHDLELDTKNKDTHTLINAVDVAANKIPTNDTPKKIDNPTEIPKHIPLKSTTGEPHSSIEANPMVDSAIKTEESKIKSPLQPKTPKISSTEASALETDLNIEDSKKYVPSEFNNEEMTGGDEQPAMQMPEHANIDEYDNNSKADIKDNEQNKPRETEEDTNHFSEGYPNQSDEDDSYFFSYFMIFCILFIVGYVGYHNKQKILALVLEGRKGKRHQRKRPNSANYHKLDSNLEEAVTSSVNKNTTNVIY